MAEPVFEDHPLQAYLRQAGDGSQVMPGTLSDPTPQDDLIFDENVEDSFEELWGWLPVPMARLVRLIHVVASSTKPGNTSEQEFSERFKYDVISSSLLSSSISAPQSARRRSFPLPGDVIDLADTDPDPGKPQDPHSTSSDTAPGLFFASPILFSLTLISLFTGSLILFIIFGITLYHFRSHNLDGGRPSDAMIPTLNTLNELIASGNVWDSAVHEAITILEREEDNLSHTHISPTSPPSTLRVTLHTSLNTTQSQADNVRHLLSALTSPASLAQISEMYAPPSPVKPNFQLGTADSPSSMTLSSTATRQREMSTPSQADQRMTWNGGSAFTYSALASAGSPSRQLLKRREKRRSDLSALLSRPVSISALTTPKATPPLAGVKEEQIDYMAEQAEDEDSDAEAQHAVPREERSQFATAAFDLQRRRRSSGMDTFRIQTSSSPPTHATNAKASSRLSRAYAHSSTPSSLSLSSPLSSYSSRFTSMQKNRHPLSLSALHHSLQGAVAAKRYAASHLLALRFDEVSVDSWGEDGEAYWEDVRAVMALLTSTLADAAARLGEALDHVEREHIRDQNPTPAPPLSRPQSPTNSRGGLDSLPQPWKQSHQRTLSQMTSFAPMPSHFSRFAGHVDAMSSALNDARDHLEECVASLRDGHTTASSPLGESPAMQAYERLRRELGLALRECERGRERLLDIVTPHTDQPPDDDDDLPALGPDAESDDSDAPSRQNHHPVSPDTKAAVLSPDAVLVHGAPGPAVHDDATLQLLLSASTQHLPPQGIEQVFEAEPELKSSFARERSKLSREERIRLAKARRESGLGVGLGLSIGNEGESARESGGVERWGPGGDVVQELKDVIWKVGERRRLMAEGRTSVDQGRVNEALEGPMVERPEPEAEAGANL